MAREILAACRAELARATARQLFGSHQNERLAEINTALTFGAKHSSKRSTKVLPSTVSKPLSCPLLQSCMVFSNVALLCP
jgi:hypothetical protein